MMYLRAQTIEMKGRVDAIGEGRSVMRSIDYRRRGPSGRGMRE